MIRAGYGGAADYTRWAVESLSDWNWLAKKAGQPLVVESGALFLGAPGGAYLSDTAATLTACGVTHERLDAAAVASRYPQIGVIGLGDAVHEARGGVIRARQAVHAAVAVGRSYGVQYVPGQVAVLDGHCGAEHLAHQLVVLLVGGFIGDPAVFFKQKTAYEITR